MLTSFFILDMVQHATTDTSKRNPTDVRLTMEDHYHILFRVLHKSASLKWRVIGTYLDLSPNAVEKIGVNCNNNVDSCLHQTLLLWLRKIDPVPTKSKIIEALKELNFSDEAEKLEEKLT